MSTDPVISADRMGPAAIALNRFGLGARAEEKAPADPKIWLRRQIDVYEKNPAPIAALPGTTALAAEIGERTREAQVQSSPDAKQKIHRRRAAKAARFIAMPSTRVSNMRPRPTRRSPSG